MSDILKISLKGIWKENPLIREDSGFLMLFIVTFDLYYAYL
jgi:hypothetical protein